MRLLVTGGAGFIGSNFIRYWLGAEPMDEIVNVDVLTYAGDPASLAEVERDYSGRYRFERADITDLERMADIVTSSKPNVIVNFAAESHNSRGVLDPAIFVRTNVLGTQTLLEVARRRGVERVHQISTCEVYGDLPLDGGDPFTEDSPYRPRTPYNASKAAADFIVRAYHQTFGAFVTISNSANNYGPWQHPEKVIPLFTTNAIDDEPLPLYRQSANRREWIHVLDHCSAIRSVLDRGRSGETYNIGTGEERTIDEIADAILSELGKPETLKSYVPDRPGHDRRYLLDHGKIERELGWRPRVTFDEGIRSTVRWYQEHRSWWAPKKTAMREQVNEFAWR